MKSTTFCLITLALLCSAATISVAQPASAGQNIIAFTGGSVWNSQTTGTCLWYFPVLGDLPLSALFAPGANGQPSIDKEHAYFLWVSDWSIQAMAGNSGFGGATVTTAVLPAGTATIYYSSNPTSRDWSNPGNPATRRNWGDPVAMFVRGGGLFHSPDQFQLSDKFQFSAPLIWSKTITVNGRPFSFRNLIPHGVTCFEYGQGFSTTETGSCVAMGN